MSILSKSNQTAVAAKANELADKSHAKFKTGLMWAAGLLGFAALTVATGGVLGYVGLIAGGLSLSAGAVAIGNYRAEKLMRKAAGEAGQEGFTENLDRLSINRSYTSDQTTRWMMGSVIGVLATSLVSLLVPPAAPAVALLHTVAVGGWSWFGMKGMLIGASAKATANLSDRTQALIETEVADKWITAANNDSGNSVTLAPSPGLAFDKAGKAPVQDDLPAATKHNIQRIYRI